MECSCMPIYRFFFGIGIPRIPANHWPETSGRRLTMYLTEEETAMLEGDKGPAVRQAMEILVALGESFGAERLLTINNVHMAGSSVLVAEEAGTRFVEDVRKNGGKVITTVTT